MEYFSEDYKKYLADSKAPRFRHSFRSGSVPADWGI